MDSKQDMKKVVIVGSGDKAHGLAHMYECHARKECWNLVFTEPLSTRVYTPFNKFVSVEPYPQSLENADVVMLAIPSYALEIFLVQNFSILKDSCILVDLTNAKKDKRDLKKTLAVLGIDFNFWVKAFNDSGAIQELQYHVASKTKLSTNVCGPNEDSIKQIVTLAEALGFKAITVPFDQYENLRGTQDTIGWEWIHATIFMVMLFLLTFVYITIQASGLPNFQWYTIL